MTDEKIMRLKEQGKTVFNNLKGLHLPEVIEWGITENDWDAKDFKPKWDIVEKYFDEKYSDDPLRNDINIIEMVFEALRYLNERCEYGRIGSNLISRYLMHDKNQIYSDIKDTANEIKKLEYKLKRLEELRDRIDKAGISIIDGVSSIDKIKAEIFGKDKEK